MKIILNSIQSLFLAAIVILVTGCASSPNNVSPDYVSPLQFQSYDCEQLEIEARRIDTRVLQLSGRLSEAASNDKIITGVGAVIFWPALFALGGTAAQESQYAHLKGEYDAVLSSAALKKCPGVVNDR